MALRRGVLVACAGIGIGVLALLRTDGVGLGSSRELNVTASEELQQAERRAALCTAANMPGVGLQGEYFASEGQRGDPLLVRVDTSVDFDRALEWPADKADRRPASARWSGWVKPPITGRYRFHADTPATRVSVASEAVAGAGVAADKSVELAAGRFYPVTLEVDHLSALQGRVRFEWTAPHGARYVIPRANLFLPSDSVLTPKS